MKRIQSSPKRAALVAGLTTMASVARAADIVYVTDLEIYTMLAPCAQSAISYNVETMAYISSCPTGDTQLQSCVCTKSDYSSAVSRSISQSVTYECGTIGGDVSSANKVFEQYCNPDTTITFPTPTANIVNAYIEDLSQTDYLPSCAQDALSWAVMNDYSENCPQDASLYAPCVCSNIKRVITSAISSEVRASCSNGEDVTYAQSFFSQYCDMNEGTTSFTSLPDPPGDMTYYISDMSDYKVMDNCAKSALDDVVMAQSSWVCAEGHQQLASCVCIKSGVYGDVSTSLTEDVKYYCDNTATDAVSSAVSVLQKYCSAAKDEIKIEVTGSSVSSYPSATQARTTTSGPSQTASTTSGSGSQGNDSGDDDTSDSDVNDSSGDDSDGGGADTATIAAATLGSVVGVAIIGGLIWFFWRRNKKQKAKLAANDHPESTMEPGYDNDYKPELAGSRGHGTLPGNKDSPNMMTVKSELPSPLSPPGAQTSPTALSPQGGHLTPEMQGSVSGGHAMPFGQPPQKMNGVEGPQQRRRQDGMGWQAGPVQSYELDSSHPGQAR